MVEIGLEGDHFGSAEANTLQYLKLGHPWCRVREVEIEGFAIVDDSSKEQLGEFPVELHNEGDAEITTSFEMVQVSMVEVTWILLRSPPPPLFIHLGFATQLWVSPHPAGSHMQSVLAVAVNMWIEPSMMAT